jgi:hypothetical protein
MKEEGFYEQLYDRYDELLNDCRVICIVTEKDSPLGGFVDYMHHCIESLQIDLTNHVSKLHE